MARHKAAVAAVVLAALSLVPFPARAEGTLLLYIWKSYYPPDLLARFEKETGIDVIVDYYETNEALLEEIRLGGRHDIIVPADFMAKVMIDEGLLQEIDTPSLPNFRNVRQPFDHPWYDPKREYTAPYMWGTAGFVYNSSQVEGGHLEESWGEFFNPRPELVGKVTALDFQRDLYYAAAFYLGFDPCTEDVNEAQQILEVLLDQQPKLAWYAAYMTEPDPFPGVIETLKTRQIGLLQNWDGGGRRVREAFPTAVYVMPKEGAAFFQDNFAVPHDAPNPENALIFINFMMDPKNIAEASNFTGYTNTIAGSEKYMKGLLAEDQARGLTPDLISRLRFVEQCSERALGIMDRVWARLWPRTVK